jgi:hypothetical protein
MPVSKQSKVLDHLITKGTITGVEAWNYYGLYRLSSAINRLRAEGWNIHTKIIHAHDCSYAQYNIDPKNPRNPHLSPDAPPVPPFKPVPMV